MASETLHPLSAPYDVMNVQVVATPASCPAATSVAGSQWENAVLKQSNAFAASALVAELRSRLPHISSGELASARAGAWGARRKTTATNASGSNRLSTELKLKLMEGLLLSPEALCSG